MPLPVEFPSPRHHSDGVALANGLLYEPSTPRLDAPNSVVVLHEWWGVDDFARHVGERLSSRHGFRCLVVDVFRGHRFTEAKLAKENKMNSKNMVEIMMYIYITEHKNILHHL